MILSERSLLSSFDLQVHKGQKEPHQVVGDNCHICSDFEQTRPGDSKGRFRFPNQNRASDLLSDLVC